MQVYMLSYWDIHASATVELAIKYIVIFVD